MVCLKNLSYSFLHSTYLQSLLFVKLCFLGRYLSKLHFLSFLILVHLKAWHQLPLQYFIPQYPLKWWFMWTENRGLSLLSLYIHVFEYPNIIQMYHIDSKMAVENSTFAFTTGFISFPFIPYNCFRVMGFEDSC